MKKKLVLSFFVFFTANLPFYGADAEENENIDVDSLFRDIEYADNPDAADENAPANPVNSLLQNILGSAGFRVEANYAVDVFYLPSWSSRPWDKNFKASELTRGAGQRFGAQMSAALGFEVQISPYLRFWQAIKFMVPGMNIDLQEFYGAYNIKNFVFIKIGKYDDSWGISPNYPYTNLLARVPQTGTSPGDLYLAKVDVPIGIGGIQFVTYTRSNLIDWYQPEVRNFAAGFKYNLAIPRLDLTLGTLYYKDMPWRFILSMKTTVFKSVELYIEGLAAVNQPAMEYASGKWDNFCASASVGFYQDFFKGKLRVNGELFYNGEYETAFYRQGNPIEDTKRVYPFIKGFNTALNIQYKPGGFAGLKAGIQFVYAINENTGEVIPGISLDPVQHMTIYFGVPLVLGNEDGTYIHNNLFDKLNERPFGFIMMVSIGGHYSVASYN